MARIAQLTLEEMTPEQREVARDILATPRKGIGGPFNAWLRSPELADRAQKLGAFCRFGSSLPPRLSELAILLTARHWTAQYEWYAHEPAALEGGLAPAIIQAIRERRRPEGMATDEQVVHDVFSQLHADRRIADDLYARARDILGERGIADLVGIMGYYGLVSMTLNVFDVEVPGGLKPLD